MCSASQASRAHGQWCCQVPDPGELRPITLEYNGCLLYRCSPLEVGGLASGTRQSPSAWAAAYRTSQTAGPRGSPHRPICGSGPKLSAGGGTAATSRAPATRPMPCVACEGPQAIRWRRVGDGGRVSRKQPTKRKGSHGRATAGVGGRQRRSKA